VAAIRLERSAEHGDARGVRQLAGEDDCRDGVQTGELQ
jgi:hypothetical protein